MEYLVRIIFIAQIILIIQNVGLGVDVQIAGSNILQIDLINAGAVIYIQRHSGRSHDIIHS